MTKENTILNTSPAPYIILGVVTIILFFGGMTAWSVYFPFQGAVIAPGTVKVTGERQKIQHLEGGIIHKLHVTDGDIVQKGDPLIELKNDTIHANADLVQTRLWAKEGEGARLRAEAVMARAIQWPVVFTARPDHLEIMKIRTSQTDIFEYRRAGLDAQTALHRSRIRQLEARIEGTLQELSGVDGIIASYEEELAGKRALLKDKYMGKANILELERSLSSYQGRRGALVQTIAEYRQMIQEARLTIASLKNTYRETAVTRLGEVNDAVMDLKEQLKPLADARHRLSITAPISGTVINMAVNSEQSGVIAPGQTLLEIVPQGAGLIIEALIRPQDITSVIAGRPAKAQLAAFQRKATPPVNGTVVYVSPDLVIRDQAGLSLSGYEAHLSVDPKDLADKGAFLSPGMPVTCYITTDERTIVSYLLDPLLKNVDLALRE